MSYVQNIVAKFGGVRSMARAVGKPPSTVASWKERGAIPDSHKVEILDAARKQGIPLTPGDFFPAQTTGAA